MISSRQRIWWTKETTGFYWNRSRSSGPTPRRLPQCRRIPRHRSLRRNPHSYHRRCLPDTVDGASVDGGAVLLTKLVAAFLETIFITVAPAVAEAHRASFCGAVARAVPRTDLGADFNPGASADAASLVFRTVRRAVVAADAAADARDGRAVLRAQAAAHVQTDDRRAELRPVGGPHVRADACARAAPDREQRHDRRQHQNGRRGVARGRRRRRGVIRPHFDVGDQRGDGHVAVVLRRR